MQHKNSLSLSVILFVSGIALTLIGLNFAKNQLDLIRVTDPYRLVKAISLEHDSRPLLLLIGSSLTQYGLDPLVLESELAARGEDYRVIKFAWGGLSPLERLYYLKFVLQYSGVTPTVVMFEVSQYYDTMPLLQFENNLYTDRMIEMMDWRNTIFALRWIYYEAPLSFEGKISLGLSVVQHCIDRYTLAGQVRNLRTFRRVGPNSMEYMPPKTVKTSQVEIDKRIDMAIEALSSNEIISIASWEHSVYPEMISEFEKAGVPRFGFYALPTPQYNELTYARSFCAKRRGAPCILPNPDLLRQLQSENNWLDYSHLFGPGRRIDSVWFASEIVKFLPQVRGADASIPVVN